MSVIYLQHPQFGAKVATMELEALTDEKNGWVRYTPEQPASQPVEPEMPNFLARTPRRKSDKGD